MTNDKLRKGIIAVIKKKDLDNFHSNCGLQNRRRSHQLISMAGRYIPGNVRQHSGSSENSSKHNSFETAL